MSKHDCREACNRAGIPDDGTNARVHRMADEVIAIRNFKKYVHGRLDQSRYSIYTGKSSKQHMVLSKHQARALCFNLLHMFPDIPQTTRKNR